MSFDNHDWYDLILFLVRDDSILMMFCGVERKSTEVFPLSAEQRSGFDGVVREAEDHENQLRYHVEVQTLLLKL